MTLLSALMVAAVAGQASAQISVDINQTFQTIRGLGYSEAFQRSQWVYNTMPDDKIEEMFDLLHDPVTGAGMSIYRIGIGSSANNSHDWMNSIEPVSPGTPEEAASYVWDRNDSSQVWWAQQVAKRGVSLFYGNSWGADAYMKDSGSTDNGGLLCGVRDTNCTTGDWRQQYADKLVQWVKYYADEGINITHLGPLNEPDISVTYASTMADGYQSTDILSVLWPTMEKAGLSHVQLTCCDWADWETAKGMIAELQESGGEDMLDVISSHGYGHPVGTAFNTTKEVWQSEWAELSSYFDQPWYSVEGDVRGTYGGGEGLTWASHILHAFTVANVSAFVNWMGAQPSNAATPLIRTINGTNILSKRYFAYAAFGRYARPGSERVFAESSVADLTVSAFTSADGFAIGGNLAMQFINNATSDVTTSVDIADLEDIANITAFLVNNEFSLAENASLFDQQGTNITVMVPAKSFVVLQIDGDWPNLKSTSSSSNTSTTGNDTSSSSDASSGASSLGRDGLCGWTVACVLGVAWSLIAL